MIDLLAMAASALLGGEAAVMAPEGSPPAPHIAAPATPLPEARFDVKVILVADKRLEVSAQWTSDEGPIFLDRITVYYLRDDGAITREIPFDIRDVRAGFDFTRRFPLEPGADLIGICAVYSTSKDAPRVRSSALFQNKGEGERSALRGAPAPAQDRTDGCFASPPQL